MCRPLPSWNVAAPAAGAHARQRATAHAKTTRFATQIKRFERSVTCSAMMLRRPPVPSLEGRLCLVTGAASGIGRATALAAARRGARLVITDINAALLDEV